MNPPLLRLAFLLVFIACASVAHSADTAKRPNIVFIITDDQHLSEFGFLQHQALTPNIDRIAKEGAYFSRGYCTTSVCTPSRYTCLTGNYASRCPAPGFTNDTTPEGMTRVRWNTTLNPKQPNVANVLQKAGYKTGVIGKWHVGGIDGAKEEVPPRGSDPANPDIARILRQNQERLCAAIRKHGFDFAANVYAGNPLDSNALINTGCTEHNMEWLTQAALTFIEEHKAEPFYLYFATTLSHFPNVLNSLKADARITAAGLLEKPIEGVQPSRESVLQRVKAAGLPESTAGATWLDDGVGAILAKLDQLGIAENTLVVFYNDNGMEHQSKGTVYEGGIHTPILARWPGVIAPQTCDKFIQNIDFAPTFFEVAGVQPPAEMHLDGASLLPLITGKPVAWRDSIYSELGYTRAVNRAHWKYIAFRVPPSINPPLAQRMEEQKKTFAEMEQHNAWIKGKWQLDPEARVTHLGLEYGGGFMERLIFVMKPPMPYMANYYDADQLYDLEKDPLETTNLAKDPAHKDKLGEMQALLKSYLVKLPGTFDVLKQAER